MLKDDQQQWEAKLVDSIQRIVEIFQVNSNVLSREF